MHGINWGDVPTWLAVVVATAGGYAALRQLRLQQEDLRRQTVQLERQQAEQINFSWQLAPADGNNDPDDGFPEYMAVVENGSARPIRDVECTRPRRKIGDFDHGIAVGELDSTAMPTGQDTFYKERPGSSVHLIPAGKRYGFKFSGFPGDNRDEPRHVRFTDDAGLEWQIDSNLRLDLRWKSQPGPMYGTWAWRYRWFISRLDDSARWPARLWRRLVSRRR